VGGSKPNQGRLQIWSYVNATSAWKATCSQGFTEAEARVACRGMSYLYGGMLRNASDFGLYPPGAPGKLDSIAMAQYNISCAGIEPYFSSCNVTSFNASTGQQCLSSQQQGIECYEGECIRVH